MKCVKDLIIGYKLTFIQSIITEKPFQALTECIKNRELIESWVDLTHTNIHTQNTQTYTYTFYGVQGEKLIHILTHDVQHKLRLLLKMLGCGLLVYSTTYGPGPALVGL